MADDGASRSSSAPADSGAATASAVLEALFENAAVGLAYWDRDLRFRRINDRLAAMNGSPVEAHLGRRPSEVIPELGALLEETFRRVLETGEPVRDMDITGETPAAPGRVRHWLASYFPVHDGEGAGAGVTGIVVEVTGEREAELRAEEALARRAFTDAELRALYSALPVGVAFLSTDLRYQRVNETLARMNGRPAAEHVGASLEDILGPAAAELAEPLRRVIETREPLELQATVPLPHDPEQERTFEATYFPVLDEDGRLLGVGGVVRDVTERHELEVQQSALLQEALVARARAEAAEVRAEDAREEAERTRVDAERAHARMSVLAQAGREMARSMDWEQTLRAVVRSAVPAVADWCSLTMAGPDRRLRVLAVAHEDPERERLAWELVARHPSDPQSDSSAARVMRSGEVEILHDIPPDVIQAAADDPEHLRLLESLNARHAVVAPLKTPDGVIGALTFVLGDSDRRFEVADVELVTSLAARAALHVQNSRLYTERSHIARTLQASLRPRPLPVVPGADVAARFLPAGDQNDVGGDFYEVFPSAEGVWTVIVGDVSGKGAEAASITALARHTLRTASLLHDDPGANLALLNRALVADSSASDFCTVLYGRLRPGPDGLDFRFSNGGHPAPLALRADGTVESIEDGRGPLVGAVTNARYGEATVRLAEGDLLVMYTDGVTEVRTSDVKLGEEELRATIAQHAGRSAHDVAAAIERRAVELQSGRPRDDIAIVVIRAHAESGA